MVAAGSRAETPRGPATSQDTSNRTVPWDSSKWLITRQELIAHGQTRDLPALMKDVYTFTDRALQRQWYELEDFTKVDLSRHLAPADRVRWLNRRGLKVPPIPSGGAPHHVEPPIIVVDSPPLLVVEELCSRVENVLKDHPLWVALEIRDFLSDGSLDLSSTQRGADLKQNLLVRTDFRRYAEKAVSSIRYDGCTAQEYLTSVSEPRVFTCGDITMFRGMREEGFPFLEEPLHFKSIVYSMSSPRPEITEAPAKEFGAPNAQWYSSEVEQTALLQRLSLIGYAAIQDCKPGDPKPILILNAAGCMDGGKHPRDAVANSLKHWRNRFTGFFHSVILSVGPDEKLAEFFDTAINRKVYAGLLAGNVDNFSEWHWQEDIVSMHINSPDFLSLGDLYKTSRGQVSVFPAPSRSGQAGGTDETESEMMPAGFNPVVDQEAAVARALSPRTMDEEFASAMKDSRARLEDRDETDVTVDDLFSEARLRAAMGSNLSRKYQQVLEAHTQGQVGALKKEVYLNRCMDSLTGGWQEHTRSESVTSRRNSLMFPTSPISLLSQFSPSPSPRPPDDLRSSSVTSATSQLTSVRRRTSFGVNGAAVRRMSSTTYTVTPTAVQQLLGEGRSVGDTVKALMVRSQNRADVRDDQPVWRKVRRHHRVDPDTICLSEQERIRLKHREKLRLPLGPAADALSVPSAQLSPTISPSPVPGSMTARLGAASTTPTPRFLPTASQWPPPQLASEGSGVTQVAQAGDSHEDRSVAGSPLDTELLRRSPPPGNVCDAAILLSRMTPRAVTPRTEASLKAELESLTRTFADTSEKYWTSAAPLAAGDGKGPVMMRKPARRDSSGARDAQNMKALESNVAGDFGRRLADKQYERDLAEVDSAAFAAQPKSKVEVQQAAKTAFNTRRTATPTAGRKGVAATLTTGGRLESKGMAATLTTSGRLGSKGVACLPPEGSSSPRAPSKRTPSKNAMIVTDVTRMSDLGNVFNFGSS